MSLLKPDNKNNEGVLVQNVRNVALNLPRRWFYGSLEMPAWEAMKSINCFS